MISRCDDQHNLIASAVWMPPERTSPLGPNQCCCGAAVVRARMPAYVVPLMVLPSTSLTKCMSLETMPAVKWFGRRFRRSITSGSWPSFQSTITWKGPKSSTDAVSKCAGCCKLSMGTRTAVGSTAPYSFGMLWPSSGLPPNAKLAPGIAKQASTCRMNLSVLHVITGPIVRSLRFRAPAFVFRRPTMSTSALFQSSWTSIMDCAEHF
mmetsp:Transcript_81830/g.227934  ORF Transcript_81830/g.227934 Transcript_81830/m.227934 type:complete len:208 (+) Transcript_81830:223-846(+)